MDSDHPEKDLFEEITRRTEGGEKVVVCTVTRTEGSTPRKAGAKMLVREDGSYTGTISGGCVEAEVYQAAVEVMRRGKPRNIEFDLSGAAGAEYGLVCGGRMEVFLERITPPRRLHIFGAGHVGKALADTADKVGFEIHIYDDHPGFANEERFPGARIHLGEWEGIVEEVSEGPTNAAVIVTRGHAYDKTVLKGLSGKDLGYMGLISSRKKLVDFIKALTEGGIPFERLRGVRAPIGLDIGGETPEEIAIAIVAEIMAALEGRDGRPLSTKFWSSPAGTKLAAGFAGTE